MNKTVAVIGGGAWGTALALLLADNGSDIRLWVYEPALCKDIREKRENTLFLPGIALPENISCTNDLREAVQHMPVILLASPSHVLRGVVQQLAPFISPETLVICITKGIENDSLKLPSQILEDILPPEICRRSCYLSGPTFALEVAEKMPTAATIASLDHECAATAQTLFNNNYFRVYTHADVLGVELGGALKNVIAIGAGISDGMGNGLSARASLITRGLADMITLGSAMGADPVTFTGLTGMGDLVLTCTGNLSRNRTVGFKLGEGKDIQDILDEMHMVAEGVKTTKSAMDLAKKYAVELPIISAIHSILYQGIRPQDAMRQLMSREITEEFG